MNKNYCLNCGTKLDKYLRFDAKFCDGRCKQEHYRNKLENKQYWSDKRNRSQDDIAGKT